MDTLHKVSLTFAVVICLPAGLLFAQAGNDNPTGVAGDFNGAVTTGCHYDPYTGNAKRSVTDLVVAGGVGTYPLAFTRTANSRGDVGDIGTGGGLGSDFGRSGSWSHSYQWVIDPKAQANGARPPSKAAVSYPDGRAVSFVPSTNGDPYYRGSQKGVQDRLQFIWDSSTTGRAYLIMPDGGKVWFSIAISSCGGTCKLYTYTVQGIIDPYGQTTTIVGSPASGLVTVTEPAGRWIKLYYRLVNTATEGGYEGDMVIDHITASDGRSVQYSYAAFYGVQTTQTSLINVTYYNDPTLVATYTYQDDISGNPLLGTCVDPMYAGPMWKIAYTYVTVNGSASGQILSENYFDGTNIGAAVSTLTSSTNTRTETRGDGKTRTFTYGTSFLFLLTGWTDFRNVSSSKTYDSNNYVNAFTDRNGHTTNFTKNVFTGGLLTATFPSTPGDTPPNTPRGVVSYTYGSASCADPNNKDSNNPYYVCTTTDEGGHTTTYTRDTNKRLTHVSYPDGGSESFQYNSFGEITNHTMTAGGLETFEYDSRGLRQKYRDAYHGSPANPNVWYQYDSLDRLSGTTDTLGSGSGDINYTTNYAYNSRSDVTTTTLPVDPNDGQRHTITKGYNLANGTVTSVTDQLGHATSYSYDDYKRLRTTTTPPRFTGDPMNHTATVYYDAGGTGEDYARTDANVTWAVLPSLKKTNTLYDENRRKTSATAAVGTGDAATTSFGYDLNGNLTSVVTPKEQPGQQFSGQSTTTAYDERNRSYSITDPLGNVTSYMYDAAGRKKSVSRANSQLTTFDSFDAMNRVLQQTVKQTPDPDAVTKYTYYTSGLLATMKDPRLVAINSSDSYSYQYDLMGRKTTLTYPLDPFSVHRTEVWHYDTSGHIDTFTNRNGNTQRTLYDNLNRAYNISWDDSGLTPTVTMGYDTASRLTSINNSNANISHTYFDDNLLSSEINSYPAEGNVARTVSYFYDADGNRAGDTTHPGIQYPNAVYAFNYAYNGRNQLSDVNNFTSGANVAHFVYDLDGNLGTQTRDNSTTSTYIYDGLDRVTHIGHTLNGTSPTFDYAYDSVSNRKWQKRDGGTGDVFGYDIADQSTSVLLNVANPDTTSPGAQTINYDANGNRTAFSAYGPTDTYTTNNLNQYTQRNSSNASYDPKGNMITGFDASAYTYDAQSRLLIATKGGTTETFTYDGLNRQVSRTISGSPTTYNVYDGWSLIAEYAAGSSSPSTAYLGAIKNLTASRYYYQDANGSTSHLAGTTGALLEWYRYDLHGTPFVNGDQNNHISAFGVRHLFAGQQWYSELGLYDLRNRFYSPDIARFLQADPASFGGRDSNLYRYCWNNPVGYGDPLGETAFSFTTLSGRTQLDIPITYSGPRSATLGAQINGLMNASGSNTIVNAYPPTEGSPTNVVNIVVVPGKTGVITVIPEGSLYDHATVAIGGGGITREDLVSTAIQLREIFATVTVALPNRFLVDAFSIDGVPRLSDGTPLTNQGSGKPYTAAEWRAYNADMYVSAVSSTGINAGPGGVFSGTGSGTGGAGPVFSGVGGVNLGGGVYGTGYGMGGSGAGYSSGAYCSLLSAFLSAPSMPFPGGANEPTHGSSFD